METAITISWFARFNVYSSSMEGIEFGRDLFYTSNNSQPNSYIRFDDYALDIDKPLSCRSIAEYRVGPPR